MDQSLYKDLPFDIEKLYKTFTDDITSRIEQFEKDTKLCVKKLDIQREELSQPDGISIHTTITMSAEPDQSKPQPADKDIQPDSIALLRF